MDWLKKLQEKYKAGKLSKEQYEAKVKELLEDEEVDQAEHDEALTYDPKADTGDKLIYSEDDMQRMAYNVAGRRLRQELKKAGVELDVDNKGIIAAVVQLAKTGKESDGKGATATEAEIAQLRKDAGKVKTLEPAVKELSLQVAVLKANGGKLQAVNPVQVVRAIKDYEDLIEYDDETGAPTAKSVASVLSKLAKVEPNLFKTPKGEGDDLNEDDDQHQQGGGFNGKTPGGAAGGAGGSGGGAAKEAEMMADALQRMGVAKA